MLLDETLPDEELEEIRRCVRGAPRRHHLWLPPAARPPRRQPPSRRPARDGGRRPLRSPRRTRSPMHITEDIRGVHPQHGRPGARRAQDPRPRGRQLKRPGPAAAAGHRDRAPSS
ncbi:MAG: hypothetical protein MZV63_34310 [Marinilabiliales bacterium]|nr:hypothetical protein [Marinilabiliales bacterium]